MREGITVLLPIYTSSYRPYHAGDVRPAYRVSSASPLHLRREKTTLSWRETIYPPHPIRYLLVTKGV